jgi:hypothetical protein
MDTPFISRFGMQLFVPFIEHKFWPLSERAAHQLFADGKRIEAAELDASKRERAKLPRKAFDFPALRAQDSSYHNVTIISRADARGSSMIGDLNFWQKKLNTFIQTPAGDWFFINPAKPSFVPASAPQRQQKVA